MSLQDRSANCFDCGETFTFSVAEQEEYKAKGYFHMPKRCLSCRQARKERQMSRGNYNTIKPGFRSEQRLYPVTCTQCGKETQVPFEPKAGREVYCRECYRAVKVSQ